MVIQIFRKIFYVLVTRVLILYLVVLAVLSMTVDLKMAVTVASLRTLNRLMPPQLSTLNDIVADRKNINQKELSVFQFYFEKVTELMPQMADAFGLYGFCSYYLGKHKKAITAYQKAIELNPAFFWFYHNLGIIYFKEGRYEEAARMFEAALGTKPEYAGMFIGSSTKMYIPILLKNVGNIKIFINSQFKRGFSYVQLLLILSQYQLKNYAMMLKYALFAAQSNLYGGGIFYYYSGLASYELKDYPKAAILFEEAIKRKKEFSEAYQYLGLTMQALGKTDAGKEILNIYQDLNKLGPTLPDPREIELEIY